MSGWVTIPTRFERPSLSPLVDAARQVARVVLVHTEPGHPEVAGVVNVHDYRRNIGHWWNTGLDQCGGPTLVLNDDIEAGPEALEALLTGLTEADLVYVPGRGSRSPTPISGWCFGLHPDRLRPDPAYVWWCGDDDLFQRAGTRILVDVPVRHLPRESCRPVDPELLAATQRDRVLYRQRWST